jgi:predicted enzyme related to lactoylglutathione lyase
MEATHVFTGLPVCDYDAALSWYGQLFERPPDRLPRPREAVWQLTGSSLVYVVEDRARAGRSLVTIAVSSLDDQLAKLAGRGIHVHMETLANGVRKAAVSDPDGNTISLFETPDS